MTETLHRLIHQLVPQLMPHAYVVSVTGEAMGKLVVAADTDAGITLGECATLNMALRDALVEELGEAFDPEMEVASPGIGQPLTLPRQYTKNIGRILAVQLNTGEELQGVLLATEETSISLGVVKKYNPKSPHPPKQHPQTIQLQDISETKVILEYTV